MDINKILKRERWVDIIISVILAVIGGILIAKPETTLNTIAAILGIIVIIYGVYKVIRFFIKKESFEINVYSNGLALGILIIIMGLILFNYIGIIESLLRIIIGLWIIFNGLSKMLESNIFKDVSKSMWIGMLITSLVTILLGLYITFYKGALIKILGILILVYAIIDIIQTIIYSRKESN